MSREFARQRELAEAVSDHIFTDKDCYMILTVVYSEGETDHLRRDLTGPRPRLNHSRRGGTLSL